MLVFFDILETFENKALKGFEQILGQNTQQYERIIQFRDSLKTNIWQSLQEFNAKIQQNQTSTFAEGIVHEATSTAFSFLKKLLEYRETVEKMLPEFFGDEQKKEEKTLVGRYISMFLMQFVNHI